MHERFPFMLDLNDLKRNEVKKRPVLFTNQLKPMYEFD